MRLSELIAKYGDDKVQFQNLDQCGITLDYTIKKGTRITFGTEQPLDGNGTVKLGLVVWLDRKEVAALIAAEKAAPAPAHQMQMEG